MADKSLCFLSLAEAARMVETRQVSPVELAEAVLEQVHRRNQRVNAFITVTEELAMDLARQAEAEVAAGGYRGPLHGIPFALKDIYATRGLPTTCGASVFADRVTDYDSAAARKLLAAGGVLMGKNHCLEFACGDHNPRYGPVRNPWNLEHTPGGSSSGSGASVAAGMAFASMGSCTGGSIRGPASHCSLVGLKPTYGLVSRYGVFPLSWSLDHAGPLTRTVEDAAIMLGAVAGYDSRDPSSFEAPGIDYRQALTPDLQGVRVGVPRELNEGASEAVATLVQAAIAQLAELGATVQEVSLPLTGRYATAAGNLITWSEAAQVHRPWLDRLGEYTVGVQRKVLVGLATPSAQYHKAQQLRRMIADEMEDVLNGVDVLVSPMSRTPPGRLAAAPAVGGEVGAERMATEPSLSRPYNLTGMPALSVPCGFTQDGLPVGLQIAGRLMEDDVVLRVAYAYEQATPWHTMHPALDG